MSTQTIDREAADKTKGFRLQKMRAIKLMLDTIKINSDAIFFTAIENVEDVSHLTIIDGIDNDYYEEDKNYSLDGNFTIFSPPVKNTLVSFFDLYLNKFKASDTVFMGFYTTKSIGKERKSKLDNGEILTLPESSILSLLKDNDDIDIDIAKIVKMVVTEEYEKQYSEKEMKGYLETLINISMNEFIEFLKQIKWFFGQENEISLKETILVSIKNSPLHNVRHANKENIIFSLLMELLDEKQNKTNLNEKLVTSSDVKLIFKDAESQKSELAMDPMWAEIEKLEAEITDKRNLGDKFQAVIKDYPEKKLAHLARKSCRSKVEQNSANKTFLSLKYRILEACHDYFSDNDYPKPSSKDELDTIVEGLLQKSILRVNELKKDYEYTLSNENLIEGIVLDLFDSCFLAFDELESE